MTHTCQRKPVPAKSVGIVSAQSVGVVVTRVQRVVVVVMVVGEESTIVEMSVQWVMHQRETHVLAPRRWSSLEVYGEESSSKILKKVYSITTTLEPLSMENIFGFTPLVLCRGVFIPSVLFKMMFEMFPLLFYAGKASSTLYEKLSEYINRHLSFSGI